MEILNGKYLTQFQPKLLQKRLQEDLPQSYRQRSQIMLLADEGKSQTEICRMGCSPATARHWTHIARAGMAHQWQDCPIGRPKAVNEQYLERLKELVSGSPITGIYRIILKHHYTFKQRHFTRHFAPFLNFYQWTVVRD